MIRARFHQHPAGHCVGALDVNIDGAPGRMTIAAVGDNRADALERAARIAERIASDPVMSALMPPQALVAIKAAKGLASAAKAGSHVLRGFFHKLHGPGAQRLAEVLHTEAALDEGHSLGDVAGLWSKLKKVAKYGTPAGLIYTGAKRLRRSKRRVPPMQPVNNSAPEPESTPDPEEPDYGDDDQGDDDQGGDE